MTNAIWQQIGEPRWICAPMVEQSEAAFRQCCREGGVDLCYTPMIHAKQYVTSLSYRRQQFSLDEDRLESGPVIAQIGCSGENIEYAVTAARHIATLHKIVVGVDLNLGCPQANAQKLGYGAYMAHADAITLVQRWKEVLPTDFAVMVKVRIDMDIKDTIFRILELRAAGASAVAVHARTKDQIQGNTGIADWGALRIIRDAVPLDTPLIANGNMLSHTAAVACLKLTGFQAVMVAEGLLWNPRLFFRISDAVPKTKKEEATVRTGPEADSPGIVMEGAETDSQTEKFTSLRNGRLAFDCSPAHRAYARANTDLYLQAALRFWRTCSPYRVACHLRKLLYPCACTYPLLWHQIQRRATGDLVDPTILSEPDAFSLSNELKRPGEATSSTNTNTNMATGIEATRATDMNSDHTTGIKTNRATGIPAVQTINQETEATTCGTQPSLQFLRSICLWKRAVNLFAVVDSNWQPGSPGQCWDQEKATFGHLTFCSVMVPDDLLAPCVRGSCPCPICHETRWPMACETIAVDISVFYSAPTAGLGRCSSSIAQQATTAFLPQALEERESALSHNEQEPTAYASLPNIPQLLLPEFQSLLRYLKRSSIDDTDQAPMLDLFD
ncbi:tRNA-dihydrouridine(16/17) synthase [Diplonema papillatum]|nr:tRNA-dihydrouridine(16/17) synthase [Diplonema papillatum]